MSHLRTWMQNSAIIFTPLICLYTLAPPVSLRTHTQTHHDAHKHADAETDKTHTRTWNP